MNDKKIRAAAAAFVREMAKHDMPMELREYRPLPVTGPERSIEMVFAGRCSKAIYDKARDKLDEENIAGLTLVKQTVKHNAEGEFDPALGFSWLLMAEIEDEGV